MAHKARLLLLLCIVSIQKVHSTLSTGFSDLTRRTSYPWSRATSESTTGRLSTRAEDFFHNTSFGSTGLIRPYVLTSTSTAVPSVTSNALDYWEQAGICELGDSDCTYTGMTTTIVGPNQPLYLSDECLLWNSSCGGNRTLAINEFFNGTFWWLQENECFVDLVKPLCSTYVSHDVMSEFSIIKNWMRSPQCFSVSSEYDLMQGLAPESSIPGTSCCGTCQMSGQNVDVYYWPDPDANTSCLSIVGSGVNSPLYGATSTVTVDEDTQSNSTITYWGCTTQNYASEDSYITTALLTSIGPVTFKEPLLNPWSIPHCVETPSAFPGISGSFEARGLYPSIHARGHSLVLPPNITQNDGMPASTVVMGEFTL